MLNFTCKDTRRGVFGSSSACHYGMLRGEMDSVFYPDEEVARLYLGEPRLERYLFEVNGNYGQALKLYRWGQELEAQVHMFLGAMEIALRNALNTVLSQHTSTIMHTPEWTGLDVNGFRFPVERRVTEKDMPFSNMLRPLMGREVFKAHKRAYYEQLRHIVNHSSPRTDRIYNHNDVISQLMFGSWAGLIIDVSGRSDERLQQQLWASDIHCAFSGLTDTDSDRMALGKKLARIHETRNRVAHHENLLYLDVNLLIDSVMSVLGSIDSRLSEGWANPTPLRQLAHEDPRRGLPLRDAAFKITGRRIQDRFYTSEELLRALVEHSDKFQKKLLFTNKIRINSKNFGLIRNLYLYADGRVAKGLVVGCGINDSTTIPDGYRRPVLFSKENDDDGHWYALNNLHYIGTDESSELYKLQDGRRLAEVFEGNRANFTYLMNRPPSCHWDESDKWLSLG